LRNEYGHAGSVEKEVAKLRELSMKFLSKLGIPARAERINKVLLLHNIIDSLYRSRLISRNDDNYDKAVQTDEDGSTG